MEKLLMQCETDFEMLNLGECVICGEETDDDKKKSEVLKLSGYAAYHSKPTITQGLTFDKDAFKLKQYKKNAMISINHAADQVEMVLGKVTKMKVDEKGLYVDAEIDSNPAMPQLRQAVRNIVAGRVKAFSVGVWIKRDDVKKEKITYAELFDISIVTIPAGVVKGGDPFFKLEQPGYHPENQALKIGRIIRQA